MDSIIDYDSQTRKQICVACQQSDGIQCNLGLKFISDFKNKDKIETELKEKLIEATRIMKNENDQSEDSRLENNVLKKLDDFSAKISALKNALTDVENRAKQLDRKTKTLEKAKLHQ